MNVTIFKDLTPEEKLASIEAKASEYIGLYVDMHNLKERKYVKDKESEIGSIRKALNASRIKKVKDYTLQVKSEFDEIDARLAKANEPFTLLHDEYKDERAKVLAKEKADREAVLMAEQKEIDHEFALLLDKSYLADKMEAEKIKNAEAEKLAAEIAKREREQDELELSRRAKNKEHVRAVNVEILNALMASGISEGDAKIMIILIAQGKINHITINY
jgi:hypothetical protein